MPANVYRIQAHPQARALFGVNYVISREVQQAEYVGRSGLQIYRNASAFPRAWVVHRARSVPTEQVAAALGLPLEEHRTVAFVRGPAPELAGCGATGSAILVERLADRLTIDADLPCPGLVVVSETWFPG